MAAANMLPNNSMNFTENQHGHAILETLRLQREQRRFCDVILHVQGQQFEAHRNVLASCSKYFQSMFKQERVVKEQLTISCGGHEIFRCLLDYIYTGNVVIDKHNVSELVRLSNHFHVLKLRGHCSEYLERYLDLANCLSVRELADRFQMRELLRTTVAFIRTNVDEVLRQQEALQLPHNKVEQLIMDKDLALSPDQQVTFALDWVQHAAGARENELRQLLVSAPLQLVERTRLLQLLQHHRLLAENERCLYFTLQSLADVGVRLPGYEQLFSQMEDKYMQDLVVDNDAFLSMAISTAIEELEGTEATIFDGLHRLQQQAAVSSNQLPPPIETFSISAIDESELGAAEPAVGEQETARDLRCHPSPSAQRYTEYAGLAAAAADQLAPAAVDKYTCDDPARYNSTLADHQRAAQRQNGRYRNVTDDHEMAGMYGAGAPVSGSGGDITYMMVMRPRLEKSGDGENAVAPVEDAAGQMALQYMAYPEYSGAPAVYAEQPAALSQCRFEPRRHQDGPGPVEDALDLDTRAAPVGGYVQDDQPDLRAATYMDPGQLEPRAMQYCPPEPAEQRAISYTPADPLDGRGGGYIPADQLDVRNGALYGIAEPADSRGGGSSGGSGVYLGAEMLDARCLSAYPGCDQLEARGFAVSSSGQVEQQQQRLRPLQAYVGEPQPSACYLPPADTRLQYDGGGYAGCEPLPCPTVTVAQQPAMYPSPPAELPRRGELRLSEPAVAVEEVAAQPPLPLPPPPPPPPPPMPAKKRKLDPGLAEELRSSELAPPEPATAGDPLGFVGANEYLLPSGEPTVPCLASGPEPTADGQQEEVRPSPGPDTAASPDRAKPESALEERVNGLSCGDQPTAAAARPPGCEEPAGVRLVNLSPKKKRLRVAVNLPAEVGHQPGDAADTVSLTPLLAVPPEPVPAAAAAPAAAPPAELTAAAPRPAGPALKTFACSLCSTTCTRRSLYYQHMLTHFEGPPFTCSICLDEFVTLAKFLVHRRTHGENKPHRCPDCNFSFWKKYNLTNHMRIHRGDRPFACAVCGAAFALRTTLKQHMTKHTSERPLSCDKCDFSTKYSNHMAQHRKMHSGDLHRCSHADCTYTTPKRSHLREHLQAHAKRRTHHCPHCPSSFNLKTHLARHLRVHDRSKLLRCERCEYETHRSDRLKRHMESHLRPAGRRRRGKSAAAAAPAPAPTPPPAEAPPLPAEWDVF